MFSLSDRFRKVAKTRQLIAREQLMLNPNKLVLVSSFHRVAQAYPDVDSHFHRNVQRVITPIGPAVLMIRGQQHPALFVPKQVLHPDVVNEAHQDWDMIFDRRRRALGPNDDIETANLHNEMFKSPQAGVAFQYVGHILHAYQAALWDSMLARNAIISAWQGDGQKMVGFWQDVNALKDYRYLFAGKISWPDIGKPPRNKPPRPERVWKPAANVI